MREICNVLEILMKIYSKVCNIKKIDPLKSLKLHQPSEQQSLFPATIPPPHPSAHLCSIHIALFLSIPTPGQSDLDIKYI